MLAVSNVNGIGRYIATIPENADLKQGIEETVKILENIAEWACLDLSMDVVHRVRCCQCKHSVRDEDEYLHCTARDGWCVQANGYCEFGELTSEKEKKG